MAYGLSAAAVGRKQIFGCCFLVRPMTYCKYSLLNSPPTAKMILSFVSEPVIVCALICGFALVSKRHKIIFFMAEFFVVIIIKDQITKVKRICSGCWLLDA